MRGVGHIATLASRIASRASTDSHCYATDSALGVLHLATGLDRDILYTPRRSGPVSRKVCPISS